MPDSTTTNFGFTLPEVNGSDDTWGEKLNDNWESIDGHLKNVKDRAEASVRFDAAMSLNATQQTRARENIGANNASNLSAGTVPNARLPERLQEAPISQSGANANNILTTGWHYVTSGSNLPLGSSAGHYLFVYQSGAGAQYVTQIAWRANDSTDGRPHVFWRLLVNGTWTDWVEMVHYGNIDPWAFQPIGVPIPSLYGQLPSNSGSTYKYVQLSAGRSDYNGTMLTDETLSGSAPTNTATAKINLPASPLHGMTVRLLNNEARFLRAGYESQRGNIENDAMQNIQGSLASRRTPDGSGVIDSGSGVFSITDASSGATNTIETHGTKALPRRIIDFDASRVVRTANETRPKNVRVCYIMRIL